MASDQHRRISRGFYVSSCLKGSGSPKDDCYFPPCKPHYATNGIKDQKTHNEPTTPTLSNSRKVPQTNLPNNQSPVTAPPSKFANFFCKRSFRSNNSNPIKRTKSASKLDRKTETSKAKSTPPVNRPLFSSPSKCPQRFYVGLRSYRSHESLLSGRLILDTHQSGNSGLNPLSKSPFGKENCFQRSLLSTKAAESSPSTTTSSTTTSTDHEKLKYISCHSSDAQDKWVDSLTNAMENDPNNVRRVDNSLKIWVLEAKGIASKKKYFCEIFLDQTAYGRTSTKQKNDLCFWGEQFDFHHLPLIKFLNVYIHKELERKKRKEKSILIGKVIIPIEEITSKFLIEKWYPIVPEKVATTAAKEAQSLRLKCRFQSIDILPLDSYSEFITYLKSNYKKICEILEPLIGVRAKEDIATSMVLTMQAEGMVQTFLADIVMLDILRVDDQRLTFRGNSLATKAMEAYLKLSGDKYLRETLSEAVKTVISSGQDCEVDPAKVLSTSTLNKQQKSLRSTVEMMWSRILESRNNFPLEIRQCFSIFRDRLFLLNRDDIGDNLISASIFLRFICPAILSPSLFNITNEFPNIKAVRNLTLVAKVLQTLANFTRFQGKESFMEFMNDFLESQAPAMKLFLRKISTYHPIEQSIRNEEYYEEMEFSTNFKIDLAKQLSILSNLLYECLNKNNIPKIEDVKELMRILSDLDNQKGTTTNDTTKESMTEESSSSISQSFLDNTKDKLTSTPILEKNSYGELLTNKTADTFRSNTLPKTNFENPVLVRIENSLNDNTTKNDNEIDDLKSSMTISPPPILKNTQYPYYQQNKSCKTLKDNELQKEIMPDLLPCDNHHGSNISISQLSNVASSGYQSINNFSQGNSPVDFRHSNRFPSNKILRNGSFENNYEVRKLWRSQSRNVPISRSPPQALAFTNPVYHNQKQFLENSSSDEHLDKRPLLCNNCLNSEASSSLTNINNRFPRTNPFMASRGLYEKRIYEEHQLFKSSSQQSLNETIPQISIRSPTIKNFETSIYIKPDIDTHFPSVKVFDANSSPTITTSSILNQEKFYHRLSLENTRNQHNSDDDFKETEAFHNEIEKLRHCLDFYQKPNNSTILTNKNDNIEFERTATPLSDGDNKMKEIISRLIGVEEELRREQEKMNKTLQTKERIIAAQNQRIATLDATNTRLISTLNNLQVRLNEDIRNHSSTESSSVSNLSKDKSMIDFSKLKTSTC